MGAHGRPAGGVAAVFHPNAAVIAHGAGGLALVSPVDFSLCLVLFFINVSVSGISAPVGGMSC